MHKVLIIGSNGYIGRPLTNQLKKKYKLILPSHSSGQIDVLNKKTLARYIKKDIYLIINLSGQLIEKKSKLKKIILKGNKNIVDLINDVKRDIIYIFISSCLVYGHKKKLANENASLNPQNYYARLKFSAENYIKKNIRRFKILRLANVYDGSKDRGFFKKLFLSAKEKNKIEFSNLLTQRNMIHLKDATKSIYHIIISKKLKEQKKVILNVGHENIRLLQIQKIFSSFFKNRLKIIDKKNSLLKDSSQIISTKKQNKFIKWKKKKISDTLWDILKKNEKFI
jgi:dTDP-4-dehydrorhamnose reductase